MSAAAFEARLVETGGEVLEPMRGYSHGYGRDAEFCYLWDQDTICVAVRAYFDRWANSRDFVLHRRIDRVCLDTLRHACHLAMDTRPGAGMFAGTEFDIANYYRHARRKTR